VDAGVAGDVTEAVGKPPLTAGAREGPEVIEARGRGLGGADHKLEARVANLGEVTNEGEFTWESEDAKQVLGEVRSVAEAGPELEVGVAALGEVIDGGEGTSGGHSGGEGTSGRRSGGQSAREASAGGRTSRTASSRGQGARQGGRGPR